MKYLGQILIDSGAINENELNQAQEKAYHGNIGLEDVLISEKKISEKDFLEIMSRHFGFQFVSKLHDEHLDTETISRLPIQYLKKHCILPYQEQNSTLHVAINDPLNLEPLDDLSIIFNKDEIVPVLTSAREIYSAINRTFGEAENSADQIIQDLDQDEDNRLLTDLEESADLLDQTSDAPIIKLVNHILGQAVKNQASDIHIEPYHHELQVRFRLDGVLYNQLNLARKLHSAIVSRIKIMAHLNIAEKRLPQDGRIEIKIGDRQVDLRVSTIPTAFGERVVLRLLEKGIRLLKLDEIGLSKKLLKDMKQLITISHGIVLVTGPTGSGKTTTLYAALNHINSPDKNILTIEDPIEYQLDGIGQMQVNSKIELTFARGLRSMVRQDPDVILVGEIRDLETAEIAIQASLTGHLVFSTLHTNDASSAITRLIDMGIEPFLVTSSLRVIIAQRLIRLLCPKCKQPYEPDALQLESWGLDHSEITNKNLYKAVGCEHCLQTGYKGRSGIYEFLGLSDTIRSLVLATSDSNQINKVARQEGMPSLREDGLQKVSAGKTSIDEVLRVTQV